MTENKFTADLILKLYHLLVIFSMVRFKTSNRFMLIA